MMTSYKLSAICVAVYFSVQMIFSIPPAYGTNMKYQHSLDDVYEPVLLEKFARFPLKAPLDAAAISDLSNAKSVLVSGESWGRCQVIQLGELGADFNIDI